MIDRRHPPLDVRPDLRDLEPYVSPQRPARYRLNTNESPYPPPDGVRQVLVDLATMPTLNRYPEAEAGRLIDAIAAREGWQPSGVWVANGSNEVFLHLFLAYGGPQRRSMTFEPTYGLHTLIARVAGTNVVHIGRNGDFSVDPDVAVREIRRHAPDVVVLCSPNNPSGNCDPLPVVRAVLEVTDGLVVVDEAYGEFAEPADTVRPLLSEYRNLALVRTFSKAWRLAGVRIGSMLADPSIVDGVRRVRLPYHLSTIAQALGCAALDHAAEVDATIGSIKTERDRLVVELQAMGVMVFPSRANFVLFRVDDAQAVWQGLLEREVLIRNYSNQPYLHGCLRVTAGTPEENDAFLTAMGEVLDA